MGDATGAEGVVGDGASARAGPGEGGGLDRWSVGLLLALAIAGYPLASYLPELMRVGSRTVSVPYRAGFLALSLLVLSRAITRRRFRQPWWIWLLVLGFWLPYLFRLTIEASVWPSALRLPWYEYYVWAFGGALIPFLAAAGRPPRGALATGLKLTTIFLGLAALSAILAVILRGGLVTAGGVGRFSASGALGSIWFGHVGASLAIVAAFLLVRPHGRTSRWATVVVAFLLVLGLAAVGLSASRGPAGAFLVVAALLVASAWRDGSKPRIVVLVGMGVAAGVWVLREFGGRLLVRLSELAGGAYPIGRARLLERSWDQFLQNPYVGSGLEEHVSRYYPHNVLLEGFMSTGVVGGLALVALLVVAGLASLRLLKRAPEHGWVPLLFIQYALAAMLSSALYMSTTMWTYLGAVLAMTWWSSRTPDAPDRPVEAAAASSGMPVGR